MSKRNTPQRRHNILALLNEQGEVSVDELAKRFETSEVTIRKDLAALESHGLLLRRYGGAITMPQELVADVSQNVSKYKQAIARAAVTRIREHARIIIDSGSTHGRDDSRARPAAGSGGDDQFPITDCP